MIDIQLTQRSEDLEQCAILMHASEPFATLKMDLERCRRAMLGEGKEVYLAHLNGIFAGFVILQLTGSFRGYIQTICICEEYRSLGIGTALIQFSEERILKISPNVFMCVTSFNHRAQKLYYSLGYEKVGELSNHLIYGADEYLLRKTTGPYSEFVPKP
jgi:ribosomal-protein-alanine N-acetyltransferase